MAACERICRTLAKGLKADPTDARAAMEEIMGNVATPAAIAAFLMGLQVGGGA
jgi:anthranilate phosphoribosyltransferase